MITRSHDATKERMMDAVLTASEDCGFENLTTKKWARTASVAEGSLYNHFNNKEDLLEQTFLRTDRIFVMQLNSIFVKSAESGSVQSAADKIINTYLVFLCDHSSELYFYQAFSCTKIYKVRTRIKLAENWAHMQEGFKLYHFKNEETAKELQSFFKETVNSYAEYLCNLDHETSDDDIEYIRKLLIMMLSYIMEEREEKEITAIDDIEDEESEEAGEEGKATVRKGKAAAGKAKAAAGKAKGE